MIVRLVADHIVPNKSIPRLEVDDFFNELLHLDLLNVDVDDKKLEDPLPLDIFDEVLLAFEENWRDMMRIGNFEVVWFDVNERLDEQRSRG